MFYRLVLPVLVGHLLAAVAQSSPPVPSGSADVTFGLYYSPNHADLPRVAIELVGSASTAIHVASWQLTDPSVVSSLCVAASGGVPVSVATLLPSSTTAAGWVQARRLIASGGTVYSCSFPKRIANNFITVDGTTSAIGNYYYSAGAVQAGSYLLMVSGTNTATNCLTTFGTLVASGTVVTAAADIDRGQRLLVGGLPAGSSPSCWSCSAGCGGCEPANAVPPPPPPVPEAACGVTVTEAGSRPRILDRLRERIRERRTRSPSPCGPAVRMRERRASQFGGCGA